MKLAWLKRSSAWLPTVLVLLVVLVAGGRLIQLGVERNTAQARAAARTELQRARQTLEGQLATIAEIADSEAKRAERILASTPSTPLRAIPLRKNTLWLDMRGGVVHPASADASLANGIASEWAAVDSREAEPKPGFMGPMRQGSLWLVLTRTPIRAGGNQIGWSVAYADLEQILANAKVGQLVSAGYSFALLQRDPQSQQSRVFVSSGTGPPPQPAGITIRAPAPNAQTVRAPYLELVIRPLEGWMPIGRLATDVGLLLLVAWLIAFGTHDLLHRSHRLQEELANSKRRLQTVNDRLMSEVEERQNLQKSFEHARFHDTFTGLPNRRYFMDQLDRALREVRARKRQGVAVMLIDIDRFKLINETLGHTAGDELMVQAARRFEKAAAGLECVLARWGGDQFALLLFDVPSNEAALSVARAMQEQLKLAFELRRHHLGVTARMGVTVADSSPQRAEDLLREADIALSVAKRPGSASAIAYQSSMGGDAASVVSLEADLHLALERNELRLLFQPIVDLRTRNVVGAEALLRWQHPVEGLLRPDKFLSIAEEAGLMVPITRWTIHRAAKIAGEWRLRLPPDMKFYISVNLSAAALRDPHLSDFVGSTLAKAHATPSSLKFELTEGGLISNVGAAREMLHRLHDLGVELMLDDFGTGYSSLNHLQLFPFDYVKIDRPFVNRVGDDGAESGIMSAMVQIASSLGLKAIAEVIETPAAAQALQKMGCDFAQGYFFGPPVEAEEALQRLRGREWHPPEAAANEPASDDSPTLVLPVIGAKADRA